MKKDSKPITRSDLVGLLGRITASLDRKFKEVNTRFDRMEYRFVRMEKRNGHARLQIKKAGKNLQEV